MKSPRVKEILNEFEKAGINGVFKYLNQSDMIIDPDTWAAQIMKDINEKRVFTAISRIEQVMMNFKKEKYGEEYCEPGK